MTEPVFRSTHAALMFALNFTHGTLKRSTLAAMMGSAGNGRGLGGLDGAAQAGMIRAELEKLAKPRRTILVARYVVATIPCDCGRSCCSKIRENAEWAEAVNYLSEYVLHEGLTGSVSHYRLRRTLVMRYFGQRQFLVSIAEQCGVNRDTASAYNQKITERFRQEERLANYEIEGLLKAIGVMGGAAVAA